MNIPQQQYRHITYLSDRSGTGVWRVIWPLNSINCVAQGLGIQADYSQTPIVDQNYYKGMNSICVQRWISDSQANLYTKFFKPLMDANSGWLRYEIDDLTFDGTILDESKKKFIEEKYGTKASNSIPFFNRGRKAFEGKQVQSNIKTMLNTADFVTVTTDYLKEVYSDIYDVPKDNIIAVPNLLPKYLFGDRYEPSKKAKQFEKAKPKNKLRIGIVSSLSHFNIDGVRLDSDGKATREQKQPDGTSKWINEDNQEVPYEKTTKIEDDFDQIAKCVRDTVNDFQWVFFGYCPPQMKDLADAGKIEVHGGLPIMNYASKLENLQLQAIVAPITKTTFNKCKSFIKYMECASIGVPLFATDCLPYSRIMPKNQLFSDSDGLKFRLSQLKCLSTETYKSLIERQWKWLNSPCKEGDFNLKNFWLEDNLNIYIDMMRMRSKTLKISFNSFVNQFETRKKKEQENVIYKNDKIMITK